MEYLIQFDKVADDFDADKTIAALTEAGAVVDPDYRVQFDDVWVFLGTVTDEAKTAVEQLFPNVTFFVNAQLEEFNDTKNI